MGLRDAQGRRAGDEEGMEEEEEGGGGERREEEGEAATTAFASLTTQGLSLITSSLPPSLPPSLPLPSSFSPALNTQALPPSLPPSGGGAIDPHLSPDGKWIAFVRAGEVCVVPVEEGEGGGEGGKEGGWRER